MATRRRSTALPDGQDRAALETLYRATEGSSWLESRNWLTDAPLGDWYGVSTNETGRVRSIGLADKDLTGPIPPEVGSLAALEVLDLNGNDLTGPIPREIGNLTALKQLRLDGNQLTGPIPPEIGSLVALKGLYLDGNRLTGPIPPEVGNLATLEVLDLNGNELSGRIPPEIGNLPALVVLGLADNRLLGPIPPEIGNLAARLRLNGNELLFGWITSKRNLARRVVLSPRAYLAGSKDAYLAELKDAYLAEWGEAHPTEWEMWKDGPELFLELMGIYPAALEELLAELTDANFSELEELQADYLTELEELQADYLKGERDYDAEDQADDLAKEMDRFWQKLAEDDE